MAIKIKPLLPTLKENKRYLIYEIISSKKIKIDLSKAVIQEINKTFGLFDSADAGIQNVEYDINKQKGVIRVATKYLDKLRTSLALVQELNDEDVTLNTVGVSGILKKARNKYIAG